MKLILKYIHLIVSLLLLSYLGYSIVSGTVGEVYMGAIDRIFGLSPLLVIFLMLIFIWKHGMPYQKRLIIVTGIVLILVSSVVYTDSTMFFGSDITRLYATLTIFLLLFGIFTGKAVIAKGQYSKKAEIVEV